jgi:hypothetical protein
MAMRKRRRHSRRRALLRLRQRVARHAERHRAHWGRMKHR